ncbi:hypothetical protein RP20_CCG019408, partial [Aedes albopictus]
QSMCCCCVTVSLNLLSNLVQRIADDIMDLIYCQRRRCPASPSGSLNSVAVAVEDQYQCHRHLHQPVSSNDREQRIVQQEDAAETNTTTTGSDPLVEVMPAPLLMGSSFYNVIYDTVELEPYFWAVDRTQSEEMLRGTPDGSCLVRPFKMKHPHIRYILSVHAAGTYFHLFIRLTTPNGLYALGLAKQKERHFKFPADIVQYYRTHRLECSSSSSSNSNSASAKIRLNLLPIIVNQPSAAPGDVEGVVITQQREENVIK